MGHSRPLFSLFSSFQYTVDRKQMFNINKFLLMTGFEPWTSGIKRPLYQLSQPHNHCPSVENYCKHFYVRLNGMRRRCRYHVIYCWQDDFITSLSFSLALSLSLSICLSISLSLTPLSLSIYLFLSLVNTFAQDFARLHFWKKRFCLSIILRKK